MKLQFFTQRAVRPWHSCPEKLWCPIPAGTKGQVEWGPELVEAALPAVWGWCSMIFKVPSNLSHSMIHDLIIIVS